MKTILKRNREVAMESLVSNKGLGDKKLGFSRDVHANTVSIEAVHVRNFYLFDQAEIQLSAGLNIVTGETGSGKSMAMESIRWALGVSDKRPLKNDAESSIRLRLGSQAKQKVESLLGVSHISAFNQSHEHAVLEVVRNSTGFYGCWDGGAKVKIVKTAWRNWLQSWCQWELQHAMIQLSKPSYQLDLVDAYIDAMGLRDEISQVFHQKISCKHTLEAWEKQSRQSEDEKATWQEDVEVLERWIAATGEWSGLEDERKRLSVAKKLTEEWSELTKELSQSKLSTVLIGIMRRVDKSHLIQSQLPWIDEIFAQQNPSGHDDFGEAKQNRWSKTLADMLDPITQLEQSSDAIRKTLSESSVEASGRLESIDQSISEGHELARKHRTQPQDLSGVANELRSKIDRHQKQSGDIAQLREEISLWDEQYRSLADQLHDRRLLGAKQLTRNVNQALSRLHLGQASFHVVFSPQPEGPTGKDQIAFSGTLNPGMPQGPLSKIASGGELSRLMLALLCELAQKRAIQTLMFDEIDQGVGGMAATSMGRFLRDQASRIQLILTTHSPQVSACAHQHLMVKKVFGGFKVSAKQGEVEAKATKADSWVSLLDPIGRVQEIARMISGESLTPESLQAARSLFELEQAR